MRRGFRTFAACGLGMTIITAVWPCNPNAAGLLRLILVVNDEVDVPAQLLQDARGVADKIFRHAGVDIVWFAARGAIPYEPVAVSEWEFRNARYVVRDSL